MRNAIKRKTKAVRQINVAVEEPVYMEMRRYSDATGIRLRKLAVLSWKAFQSLDAHQRAQLTLVSP